MSWKDFIAHNDNTLWKIRRIRRRMSAHATRQDTLWWSVYFIFMYVVSTFCCVLVSIERGGNFRQRLWRQKLLPCHCLRVLCMFCIRLKRCSYVLHYLLIVLLNIGILWSFFPLNRRWLVLHISQHASTEAGKGTEELSFPVVITMCQLRRHCVCVVNIW